MTSLLGPSSLEGEAVPRQGTWGLSDGGRVETAEGAGFSWGGQPHRKCPPREEALSGPAAFPWGLGWRESEPILRTLG